MLLYMLPISLGNDVFQIFVCALAQQNEITGTEEPSLLSHNPHSGGHIPLSEVKGTKHTKLRAEFGHVV